MAFDGFFCVSTAYELSAWTGAKVEKIHQSAPSCIYLCLYKDGQHVNLVLSVSASRPVIAVTREEIAKPKDPTSFCMLLRKHLQNGRIQSVECLKNERIVHICIESADELGFLKSKHLYAEMMGKYSNLILANEENRIVCATATADLTASVRQVMPGMPYEQPPKQEKLDALSISEMEFLAMLNVNDTMRIDKFLLGKFFSFSPVVAREIAYRATGDVDTLIMECDKEKVWKCFSELIESIRKNQFRPCAVYDGEKGVEYSFTDLTQYHGFRKEYPDSFSDLLLKYFAQKEEAVNLRSYASDILKTVNSYLAREQKKLVLQHQELQECEKKEELRNYGDLLMANLYQLKQGMPAADVLDYQTGETVTVPMNPRLTPAQNAQEYYKKYAKMKRASEALQQQIQIAEQKVDHLESILDTIDRAQELKDLDEIRRELTLSGFGKKDTVVGKKKPALSKPLEYRTSDGKTVYVGRNNLQNDALTGSANRRDLWFHIKKYHGSHVILCTEGEEPTDHDYTEAAMLAAFHSEKKGSTNVEVDYTRVKNLKKPSGSAPGFVTYETYYSAVVDATEPSKPVKKG